MTAALLEVEALSGAFRSPGGDLSPVLFDVGFSLQPGVITAIVGETGSGKSLTALSILGIQPKNFLLCSGRIVFEGRDLLSLPPQEMRAIRGRRISMVFQDARAALNPVFTVGRQLADVHRLHHGGSAAVAMRRAIDALCSVAIPEPERRAQQYPHEFSGGMAQRAMIAMAALVCTPRLVILDEPTTGLDVTIQAAIMELIAELVADRGLTACLITHDLGVVAETCAEVVVMEAGHVVETGNTEAIFTRPRHAYTQRLLAASLLEDASGPVPT
jgi:ABC-type dipeptide/oligopeptide/nickel transport system ATPase component